MNTTVKAYAAKSAGATLAPFSFDRRTPKDTDVCIDILYCGICHSDIHAVKNEWGGGHYPLVPGHEVVGKVTRVGEKVSKFCVGDIVGVGCYVDSCRTCIHCKDGLEQLCLSALFTYNSFREGAKTPTYGGYSTHVVVDENYVLRIPDSLSLERAAPLLCAGITTYSPLANLGVQKGWRIAVCGLGGLGHMAVKIAASMGASVSVLSTSPNKAQDAKRLGAHEFYATSDSETFTKLAGSFDAILDTISATHDMDAYLSLLKRDGTLTLVGLPGEPLSVHPFSLVRHRKKLTGSLIGGIAQTQEMLDYCGKHHIMPDVEIIPMQSVNEAYARVLKSDVRYRFVIDMQSLR